MDVVVTVRQTGILRGNPILTSDEKSVDMTRLKRHINEWDLYALEEALRIKESKGARITVVSAGDKKTEEAIYYCLAAGANEGILIEIEPSKYLDSWQIASLLARVVSERPYDLVFSGVQSEDEGCAEVGAILARMLDIPLSSTVIGIKSLIEGGTIEVQNELEEGFYDIRTLKLPALITIQTGINQPRYVSSLRLRSTKKKRKITKVSPESLGINMKELDCKKLPKRLFIPEFGSAKLDLIEGASSTEKANILMGRLYDRGVL
jgi:electron transfer flavoprotein beta subunit